ncbi:variant 2 [Lathyrus oleraceus]|uniref:Variant 2 n=1 Tax=Pisum sativum TaxID=3888 RepID=A0A9D4YJY8_PEA|nr:variant 2 [Pisum sativum]
MSCISFSQFLPLPRCNLSWSHCYASLKLVQFGELRVQCKPGYVAMARKKASLGSVEEEPSENEPVVEKKATKASKAKKVTAKKVTAKTKKKPIAESPEERIDLSVNEGNGSIEEGLSSSSDGSKKKTRKSKKKDASSSAGLEEEKEVKEKKKVSKRRKPKEENVILEDKDVVAEDEIDDQDEPFFIENKEDEIDDGLELIKDDGEDISYTYGWPPLVCCFGAAQYAFVPSEIILLKKLE